jgi:hypothetical protein
MASNVAAAAALLFGLIVVAVAVSFRNTNRRVDEYGGVLRRLAFSYVQMLGVLGIFKARGTKVFNEWIGKSSEVAGGSLTAWTPIKCLLESQSYGPFLLNMMLPGVFAVLTLIVLIPTTLVKRKQEDNMRKSTARRLERRKRASGVAPSHGFAPFEPPPHEPVVNLGRRCGGVPTRSALAVPCCRRVATEEYIANERRHFEGQPNFAPQYRPFLGFDAHSLWGLPLALMLSCTKCRVETTDEDRAAWRADAAVRSQRVPRFLPHRRFVAVMMLVAYSLYPALVASTASMFSCSDKIGEKYYLMADLTVTCYEGWHIVYLALATIATIVFCIGIPLGLAALLIFEMCMCTAPPRCPKDALSDDEAAPSKCRQVCGSCSCTCARRSQTPWGYQTTSVRARFGLFIAGYDTQRGSIVMAWEPLVVMLRKLFITLAGARRTFAPLRWRRTSRASLTTDVPHPPPPAPPRLTQARCSAIRTSRSQRRSGFSSARSPCRRLSSPTHRPSSTSSTSARCSSSS